MRAFLTMTNALRPYPSFLFSWILGPGTNLWSPSPIPRPSLHIPNQSWGSGKRPCGWLNSASVEGEAPSRASAQLDVTFTLKQRERVSMRPLSPQLSALHEIFDCPDNGQDQTERSPDPKGPWRHKNTYSPHPTPCPPLPPNHRALGSGLCLSCFM